jgi:hypothetical protein
MRKSVKIAAGIGVPVVAIIIGVSAASAGNHPATPSAATPTFSVPAPTYTVPPPTMPSDPVTTPAAPAKPAAPAMTVSQEQAVQSAKNYLQDGQGFSESGLLNQLTSSSGEGFSQADAKFAIKYLHPDWYAQAVLSAKNYMHDGQGFSRSELLDQLTSSYGEGFTQSQALYAVGKVGL